MLTVVVCDKAPDVPIMVTVAGPVVAVALAVSVSVLVLDVVDGLNEAVTPAGSPEAEKFTVPVKPPVGVTVTVLVLLPPCGTLMGLGDAPSVNPAATGPASVTASTTTLRLGGNVRLCTPAFVLSAKE
jgi:hypothetical protein